LLSTGINRYRCSIKVRKKFLKKETLTYNFQSYKTFRVRKREFSFFLVSLYRQRSKKELLLKNQLSLTSTKRRRSYLQKVFLNTQYLKEKKLILKLQKLTQLVIDKTNLYGLTSLILLIMYQSQKINHSLTSYVLVFYRFFSIQKKLTDDYFLDFFFYSS